MRRLLVLVGTVVFVDAMLFGALAPLIPGYADEFDLSKAGAGLLLGAFGAGALAGGVPGGLVAARLGPRQAVVGGLAILAAGSFAFASAGGAWTLAAARFLQGVSSAMTWSGGFAWLTVTAPRARRGEIIGAAFGTAVFGAIVGPVFGAVADVVSIRVTFASVGLLALGLAAWAAASPPAPAEPWDPSALPRAARDRAFLGGLWLTVLPALLFGTLAVLAPLRLDELGFGALAIGLVFFVAGLGEATANPLLGRFSDRRGRFLPVQASLLASAAVAAALAGARGAGAVTVLVALAAVAFGSFYTPGMALASDRAERVGLAQGLAFGTINIAWAIGNLAGPAAGGALAAAFGDGVPYLAGSALCLVTLAAVRRVPRTVTA